MQFKKTGTLVAGVLMAVGMASPALADSNAGGFTAGSGGILSGNVVQAPIDVPINVCGNTINVIGLFNPAVGNRCVNGSDDDGPSFFNDDRPPYYAGYHNGRHHYRDTYGRYPYGGNCHSCRCDDDCDYPRPCTTSCNSCEDNCHHPQPCPTNCNTCEDNCHHPRPCTTSCTPCDDDCKPCHTPCNPCEDDDDD
ncbi:chaplin [Streptomyces sp. NPDC002577]